ncbi:hypothetical protein FQA39_LY03930 [Lamprigera yunnana]|nr:hypothetical protein FQA39_LY03930 [Lamprigera yunnana]
MIFKVTLLLLLTSSVGHSLDPYQLEDIFDGTFKDKGWNGTWISDTHFLVKDKLNNIFKVNVSNNFAEYIVGDDILSLFKRNTVTISEDFRYLLIKYNKKTIFRHSTLSQYAVYDITNKNYHKLHGTKFLQLAKWAPVGHRLIYIYKNNIYYIPKIEDISNPKQITKDGVPGIIFNGLSDWVYEEEVFSSSSALWFSPDGKSLAFGYFDDYYVSDYHYILYDANTNGTNQYPSVVSLKYPKAGSTNPVVKLKYVDLEDPQLRVLRLEIIPQNVVTSDHILVDVTWINNNEVAAASLNRVQNLGAVSRCNVKGRSCHNVFTLQQRKGWLNLKLPTFFASGEEFLLLTSEPEGNDYYRHISLVGNDDILKKRRLTSGEREILSIYGVDEQKRLVYYQATVSNKYYQQHVYAFDFKNNLEYCLTCNMQTPEGLCEVGSASFSKNFSYITRICSGPGPKIVQVQNLQTGHFFMWEDNKELRNKLSKKLQPKLKTLQVPISNNFYATVRLLLPPKLNESSEDKYPTIVNVYAGPDSNRISNAYSNGIQNYFVTNRNYIYVYIDARGSGKSGNNLLFQVYRRLGTVEIEDQITVTKYLQDRFPFIDKDHVGIWGWSYGGFATLFTLLKDVGNIFKFGVAVAPVTSFLYYDSIYTERYMGLPKPNDNLEGYKNADIIHQVEGLRNKSFYVIHGNADDNVHYQQSMLLAKNLERADIMFYQQSYPDENHSLGHVKHHLYHTIDHFFSQSIKSTYSKKWSLKKVFLCTILISAVLGDKVNSTLEPYTLEECYNSSYGDRGWNGTWITDTEFVYKNNKQNFHIFNANTNSSRVFLNASVLNPYPRSSISFSPTVKFALIKYNEKAIFRHSKTAQYAVYDIENRKYYDLHNKEFLQLVKWDPQGSGLAYVLQNNIYYLPNVTKVTSRQITRDGVVGVIYNGVPDWIYEEEVFGSGSALWFSPDGNGLTFAQFNDTLVSTISYLKYGEFSDQYPNVITLKYPKVGTINPTVIVKYINLTKTDGIPTEIKGIVPIELVTKDHVLKTVTWANNTDVVAVSFNRIQNKVAIVRCNLKSIKCRTIYNDYNPRGWLETTAPIYNYNGTKSLMLLSETEGNDSYKHLSIIYGDSFQQRKRLTFGKREAGAVYGWDTKRNLIYYVGTVESNQQVYVVNLNSNKDQCITCNFTTPEGKCLVASASISKNFSYMVRVCHGPGPQIVQILNLQKLNYFTWEDNQALRVRLVKKLRPVRKDIKISLKTGFDAYVRLLLPPGLNENSNIKYPMIVNVYAGPNSNQISDAYSYNEDNYFVTNRKYIYAFIDGRGSGRRGSNLMFQVYRRLGTVEIKDQIEVTRYLEKRYNFIDGSKIGIWGWSYGGFATLSALVQDSTNVFKWGLAVAPVTNFILYDSIYTERYMGLNTKEDNIEGYNHTDISRAVEALRNKTFYIIHGNADDNVHYQQSMLLSKALEKADILFFQQSYPDENHGIGSVRPHLYHSIDKFFNYGFQSKKENTIRKLKENE